ncbi:hypothetical protein TD95_005452 [Thielaviopsis punctulata]|uniref:Basic proline-rich protein n=1 Tax=Thielaviopsis punctulata TaxID=72032 RepID=A0A0F4ZGN8_9PEZI|nr:hypothetical protein TD95_005452 [Thielaviopsis punctulata]
MDPVPETERLEEFKTCSRPSLILQTSTSARKPRSSCSSFGPSSPVEFNLVKRPQNFRRSTDPITLSANMSSSCWGNSATSIAYRPRTTSPLSFGSRPDGPAVYMAHSRSKSHLGFGVSRTQSLSGLNSAGHLLFSPPGRTPTSPSSSPQRARVPKRNPDDIFPTSPIRTSVLEGSPRRHARQRSSSPSSLKSPSSLTPFPPLASSPLSSPQMSSVTLSSSPINSSPLAPSPLAASPQITMSRVRPTSPLRNPPTSATSLDMLATESVPLSRTTSVDSAPPSMSAISSTSSLSSSIYTTSFSNLSIPSLAGSSVPSTPSSTRSRSPSLSSLETIPDTPDAEEAAAEADRLSQLKAVNEPATVDLKLAKELRGGRSFRDKRKRWSVCGAERRGDLDLETIWED